MDYQSILTAIIIVIAVLSTTFSFAYAVIYLAYQIREKPIELRNNAVLKLNLSLSIATFSWILLLIYVILF